MIPDTPNKQQVWESSCRSGTSQRQLVAGQWCIYSQFAKDHHYFNFIEALFPREERMCPFPCSLVWCMKFQTSRGRSGQLAKWGLMCPRPKEEQPHECQSQFCECQECDRGFRLISHWGLKRNEYNHLQTGLSPVLLFWNSSSIPLPEWSLSTSATSHLSLEKTHTRISAYEHF